MLILRKNNNTILTNNCNKITVHKPFNYNNKMKSIRGHLRRMKTPARCYYLVVARLMGFF